jgi:hypothetical protein
MKFDFHYILIFIEFSMTKKLEIQYLPHIRNIRKFTLSLWASFHPLNPLLVVSVESKEILLNLSMKC